MDLVFRTITMVRTAAIPITMVIGMAILRIEITAPTTTTMGMAMLLTRTIIMVTGTGLVIMAIPTITAVVDNPSSDPSVVDRGQVRRYTILL